MRLYPKETFLLETAMPVDEIHSALEAGGEPEAWIRRWWPRPCNGIEGKRDVSSFKILPKSHRSWFYPVIEGDLPRNGLMFINMRLHRLDEISVWACILSSFISVARIFAGALNGKHIDMLALTIAIVLFLSSVFYTSAAFWEEVQRIKPLLVKTLKGKECGEKNRGRVSKTQKMND